MAGGLVGAILGGALGAGTASMMIQEFTCCSIFLQKLQVQGELNAMQISKHLENILADTYSNTLGM